MLAQALDQIHSSAAKSETLTSFHDFDGGQQRGAKELVSNGVSGLYNRLKQSVGGGTPSKDSGSSKGRPASKDSQETASSQSSLSVSRSAVLPPLKKPPPDVASVSTASVAASPVSAGFTGSLQSTDLKPSPTSGRAASAEGTASAPTDQEVSVKDYDLGLDDPESLHAQDLDQDKPVDERLERTRSALIDDDRSESATQALARVLLQQDAPNDRSKQPRPLQLSESSSLGTPQDPAASRSPSPARPVASLDVASGKAVDVGDELRSPRDAKRPPLIHIGPSHLPGFKPSRASSMGSTDLVPSSSTPTISSRPQLDPSPSINSALQRRRTTLKAQPAASSQQSHHHAHVPHHLKRRVISKEFWMKDENAKDCFYCGQSFSTFRRKHHCRTCGQIFDARCTSLVPGRPFGQPGTLRLCKPCEAMIYGSDDDSTVFSDDGDEIPNSAGLRTSIRFEDELPGRADGGAISRNITGEVATPSIGIPASRRNREAKRRSAVIEFDAHPTLARPSSSHSLISLARRPRSSSHRRHNSRAQNIRGLRPSVDERGPFHPSTNGDPEKRGSLPTFHNDNIIDPDLAPFLSDEGSEDDEPPSIMSALEAGTSPGERERLGVGGLFASAAKKGRSRLGDRATTASSVRGVKDDDALSTTTKHPKLSRKRNQSISSTTIGRPSPRRSKSNLLLKTIETEDFEDRPMTPVIPPSPCTKLVRSASMQGSDMPPVEMNRASLEHVCRMLAQLLTDHEVEHAHAWEKALLPILLQCTDDVKPCVQAGDDMDIRHYVKLKKVPGGRPGDTSYISGVVFSKNVALKSMARSIRNPRIAIVTFSIEYARHQTHFMSLEPVIAQEREYLNNLVGRIAALKPQVLLVQRNVSGLALRLLEQAGIAVAFNIKESVLAAVARVTQSPMIKSVDKLAIDPSHLGRCGSFEVKTYVSSGARKTYIYLSGCMPELGCTIVLRGADTKLLRQIKRITEFMCYVVYNLKLESTLLRDEFVSLPSATPDQLTAHDGPHHRIHKPLSATMPHLVKAQSDDDSPSKYEEFEEWTRSRILSASPFVVFMQPWILTQLREQETKLATYKHLRDQYAAADEEGDEEKQASDDAFALVRPEMVNAPANKDQPKAVREYLHAVHDAQYDNTMHAYETQKRLWDSFMQGAVSPFDPFSHQTIAVLHSTVSSITSAPCTGPEVLGISFYAGYNRAENTFESDCTLGQYVEDVCMSASTSCKECGKKMHEHHRQYVHGYGQLSVSVQRHAPKLRGYDQSILMWSSCRKCHAETPVAMMSDDTWKYSFAKYLELSFWGTDLHPRGGICDHDIHKNFLRCFGFQGMAVKVQYDPVDIYEVVVPRSVVNWKVETDLTVKNEHYTNFLGRLNAFIESIRKRLDSINVDTLDEKRAAEAHEKLSLLRQRVEEEHKELLAKLQQKYATSRYYELIPLNRALRMMDEKAIAWDEEFNNFERDYFPSETDIRKLATLQLRNMFLESQPSSSSLASDASDAEEGTELTPMNTRNGDSRVETKELQLEKATDVLTSTAMEHRSSRDITIELPSTPHEKLEEDPEYRLTRKLSPREEQEQAVEREEVKHLDLAVPSMPENEAAIADSPGSELTKPSSRPITTDGKTEEPFATQPKPLSSGLLERIEQIRSNRVSSSGENAEPTESRIPRLANLKKRDISPRPVPPLLRAQSQPGHVPRISADLNSEHSIDSIIGAPSLGDIPQGDKRLGERLGVARLASKVGKAAPSLIPRSIPQKSDESTSSSVSALAKHFEQMSREFEKERLKERRQRALRSRQARANPLASSRPVVEVYRNATEAVGEKPQEVFGTERSQVKDYEAGAAAQDPNHPLRTLQVAEPSSSDETRAISPDTITAEMDSSDETMPQRQHHSHGDDQEGDSLTLSRTRDWSIPLSGPSSSTLVSPLSPPDMELTPELSIPEHRKNVWFKYLADFWSKRSASGWANLEYPLHGNEHVFEDSDIIVREDEPSSVIALSLACADYQNKVQEFRSHPSKHARKHAHTISATSNSFTEGDHQQKAIEDSLLSDTGTHMKYSFAHGPVKASCKIFYAESFDALRRRTGVADRFVESMSRCLKFDSKGGKTKSLFLKTLDGRFIIKSLQEVELKAFTKFAPDYFAFMSYTLFHGVPSVIAKMFGLFQVTIKNPATGVDFSYYLLVMENLFYERNPNRRFDLKGSMRNRKIESTGQPDEVLLDENLVETIFESPLFVRDHARKLLHASVFNDTMWLCKQNVMDYSLMAGFDDERKELIVGIIDCIRTYTWDKKLESWIKDRGKNKPTITSPKEYRNRFRVSMMQYVLQSPTPWHQFQAAMALPKTLREEQGQETMAEETEADRKSEGL